MYAHLTLHFSISHSVNGVQNHIGCLDDAVVPNQDRYWFGPSVEMNNFVSVQTFGLVQLGPPQHQGPGPIQLVPILVRYKFSV